MTSADITALRAQACRVIAELGQALACLEDAEGLLYAEGLETMKAMGQTGSHAAAACSALAHERFETACGALDAAAAHLGDLAFAADRLAQSLAPSGDDSASSLPAPRSSRP